MIDHETAPLDQRIPLLFVDDKTVVRLGLASMLTESGDYRIVHSDGIEEALELLEKESFSVLILAGSIPANSRIEAVAQLRKAADDLPILIVDDGVDEIFARQVMKHGARGYISSQSPPAELVEALHRLLAGRSYMSSDVARLLAVSALSNEVDPMSTLSPREREVFDRLARGQAVGDIATELKLTSKTVSNHRLAVLKKLNVKTTVDLARLAFRRGERS